MESSSSKSKQRNTDSRQDYKQQDQQAGSRNCLYINLSPKIDNEIFKSECQKFGQTEYAYVIYEPGSHSEKISRGYAFVRFKNEQDAINCKESLHGKDFYGQKCMVQYSKRDRPREQTPGKYLGHRKKSPGRYGHERRRSDSRSRNKSQQGYRRSRSRDRYYRKDRDDHDRYDKERYSRRDRDGDRYYRERERERSSGERERGRERGDRDRVKDRDRYARERRYKERSQSTEKRRRSRSRSLGRR